MASAVSKLALSISVFFFSGFAAAALDSQNTDSSKTVVISIFDLVHRHPLKTLPPGHRSGGIDQAYLQRVREILKEGRPRLLECLKENESLHAQVTLQIQPSGDASAKLKAPGDSIADCTVQALGKLKFPSHPFATPIEIELPLEIQRQTL